MGQKYIWMSALVILLCSTGIATGTTLPKPITPFTVQSATLDNNVQWDGVFHDSRDGMYRSPGWGTTSGTNRTGALPIGTGVTLRIRTVEGDLSQVKIRFWDGVLERETLINMTIISILDGFDFWEGNISSPLEPSDIYYRFELIDGTDTDYYQDDLADGGMGQVNDNPVNDADYGIVFYDPGFSTPSWHKMGIGYQIMPDRFYNGDPTNDAIGNGSNGDIMWWEWDSNGDTQLTGSDDQRVYATKMEWNNLPISPANKFYGGDLAGIRQKTNYLADLGINFIWLNPISESPDYHGYAVDDYLSVDPYLGQIEERIDNVVINNKSGSLHEFDLLASTMGEAGIRLIYDAVINHISAQSKYFQRFEINFGVVNPYGSDPLGAYQSVASPYADWFEFTSFNHDYNAWWGFKNIPTLMYKNAGGDIEETLITGDSSLFTFWNEHHIGGFRLDVPNMYQDDQGSRYINQLIREVVKGNDPNDLIIGEIWQRANAWLTGTMFDGVQNMPFRDATITWIRYEGADESYIKQLIYPQENYPPEAFAALWTILGNHDTVRILTSLQGNITRLKLAAFIQFMYAGVPLIYYGDEVGLEGDKDPDCRRTFPWGNENTDILEHYKKLIHLRTTYPVLQKGSFEIIPDTITGVMTFLRELPGESYPRVVIPFNRNSYSVSVKINMSSVGGIDSGAEFIDVFNDNKTYIIDSSHILRVLLPPASGMVLLQKPIQQTTTSIRGFYLIWVIGMIGIGWALIQTQIHRQRRSASFQMT